MNDYFCGLYFKCQSEENTVAVIPAFHKVNGKKDSSIQLISNSKSFSIPYSYSDFTKLENGLKIGKSYFGMGGIHLDISSKELSAFGDLVFNAPFFLKYDIMGPFKYVPFMECRHSVFSMHHYVFGELLLNGESYRFNSGNGYTEGDRGRSFPSRYVWTQSFFDGGSLMMSVADVPIGNLNFTGVICAVFFEGKEYRIASYLGAKAVKIGEREIIIRQGDITFSAALLEKASQPLKAPDGGAMSRIIHESPACHAAYSLIKNGHRLFEFETCKASFEYEY